MFLKLLQSSSSFFPKVASSRINWWKLWLSVDCLSIWQAGHYLGSSQVNGNIVIIPKWAIMLDQHIISPLVLQHQLDRKKSEILCQSLSKRDSIIIFRSSDQSSAQSWLSKTHQQDLDLTIQEFSSYQLKIKASKCCSWDEKPESYSFPKNQLSWINTSVTRSRLDASIFKVLFELFIFQPPHFLYY